MAVLLLPWLANAKALLLAITVFLLPLYTSA
jgi:hypothetical protein